MQEHNRLVTGPKQTRKESTKKKNNVRDFGKYGGLIPRKEPSLLKSLEVNKREWTDSEILWDKVNIRSLSDVK